MLWQLRATAGPLEGAVYVLRRQVMLGRAGDCDIQIISDGVSRQHAKVVAQDGGYVLVDLRSNNGTYVGEQRVERHVLRDGEELRIMRTRFVFEPVPSGDEDSGDLDVWAVKVTNSRTLRQTVDHLGSPPPPPLPSRGDTAEDLEAAEPASDGSAHGGAAVGASVKRRSRGTLPERHRLTALRADGQPYSGDLVGDILMFRDLQLRTTRHETLLPLEQQLLQRFGEAFRQPRDDDSPYASLRRFQRFRCRFPARARWVEGPLDQATAVTVLDLGVGGARVAWSGHPMREGVVAWLVVDVVSGHRPRTLVFPTRVAWCSALEVGLQFAGMPEWEQEST